MKHKSKRIIDFLETADVTGLDTIVWSRDDDEHPLWQGAIYDMPWWVARSKLDYKVNKKIDKYKAMEYRSVLTDNRAGFIIFVK